MSNTPNELRYASSHEWVRLEENGTVTIGISDHAQDALGDVVYVDTPDIDANLAAGDDAGVVESVKAASDIFSPVSGVVIAVNEVLEDEPETVNTDPYHDGWFFKMTPTDTTELNGLMSAEQYLEHCEEEE
ncbi:MAG: glycine cleavage system protein GcvH [Spongiibacteraceae bacterium]|nr:glycine cleavage system protein GcvH [Spongiibacteraceae bacterium]